jgi:hypothetical protein
LCPKKIPSFSSFLCSGPASLPHPLTQLPTNQLLRLCFCSLTAQIFLISWSAVTPPHNKPVFVLISDPAVTVSSRLDSHPSRSLIPSCLTTPPKIMTLSFFFVFLYYSIDKKKVGFFSTLQSWVVFVFFVFGWLEKDGK